MNTVFQVKNSFDRDILVTSSIGIKATIEPGVAFDINFPSDVHKVIAIEVAPAQVAEPKEPALPVIKPSAPVAPKEALLDGVKTP